VPALVVVVSVAVGLLKRRRGVTSLMLLRGKQHRS